MNRVTISLHGILESVITASLSRQLFGLGSDLKGWVPAKAQWFHQQVVKRVQALVSFLGSFLQKMR